MTFKEFILSLKGTKQTAGEDVADTVVLMVLMVAVVAMVCL